MGWAGDIALLEFRVKMIMKGENYNFVPKGTCASVTHYEHNNIHKYSRVGRGQDGMEVMSKIDLLLGGMLKYVLDVKTLMGMERSKLGHSVALCKMSK